MKLLIQFLCLLVAGVFSPATAYDTASTNALEELATVTNSTTIEIIDLNGCDYTSTTEAIEQQVPISDGSACPSADMSILGFFTSLSQQISSVTQELVTFTSVNGQCHLLIRSARPPHVPAMKHLLPR